MSQKASSSLVMVSRWQCRSSSSSSSIVVVIYLVEEVSELSAEVRGVDQRQTAQKAQAALKQTPQRSTCQVLLVAVCRHRGGELLDSSYLINAWVMNRCRKNRSTHYRQRPAKQPSPTHNPPSPSSPINTSHTFLTSQRPCRKCFSA